MDGASSATNAALRSATDDDGTVALLEALRDADVDPDAAQRLGAQLSGAHVVANREESARESERLLTENEVERVIHERESGRLCDGHIQAIAQETVGRSDRDPRPRHPPDERRKLRAAGEVAADLKTLGVDGRGIEALTTASARASVDIESDDSETDGSEGIRESVGKLLS